MTPQEREAIEKVTDRVLHFRDAADGFVELLAGPCPLLNDDGLCSVYWVRPMNCRRYLCGRDGDEPWVGGAVPARVLTDLTFLKRYADNEKDAQAWGRKMGWPREVA